MVAVHQKADNNALMYCFDTQKIILYIDDDKDALAYLDMILPEGYQLLACNYSELLANDSCELDATLLIIDPDYCHGTGLLLIKMIAARFPCLAILAYSHSYQPEMVTDVIKAGVKYFIDKPIERTQLWDVLAASQRSFTHSSIPLQGIKQIPNLLKLKDSKRCFDASRNWNPILIAGESGTGKTTLARALATSDQQLGLALVFDGKKDKLPELSLLIKNTCIILENFDHFNKKNLARVNALVRTYLGIRPIKLIATICNAWESLVPNKYRVLFGEKCQVLSIVPLRERRDEYYSIILKLIEEKNIKLDMQKTWANYANYWKSLFDYSWPGNLIELELFLREHRFANTLDEKPAYFKILKS